MTARSTAQDPRIAPIPNPPNRSCHDTSGRAGPDGACPGAPRRDRRLEALAGVRKIGGPHGPGYRAAMAHHFEELFRDIAEHGEAADFAVELD